MLRLLSKGLELLGLLIVPVALLVGLFEENNAMMRELTILFVGAGIFLIGYALERYAEGS